MRENQWGVRGYWRSGGAGELGTDGVYFVVEKGNEVVALIVREICVSGWLWF